MILAFAIDARRVNLLCKDKAWSHFCVEEIESILFSDNLTKTETFSTNLGYFCFFWYNNKSIFHITNISTLLRNFTGIETVYQINRTERVTFSYAKLSLMILKFIRAMNTDNCDKKKWIDNFEF